MEQKAIGGLDFLKVFDSIMEQKGIGSLVFPKVLVLKCNSHPHFLIFFCKLGFTSCKTEQPLGDMEL